MNKHWLVRLSASGEHGYREILRRTLAHFGGRQAGIHAATPADALRDFALGPAIPGAREREREEIGPGIRTLHVARKRHKGRHLVLFRIAPSQERQTIDVLRLLHDSMDLQRHLPTADEPGGPNAPGKSLQ